MITLVRIRVQRAKRSIAALINIAKFRRADERMELRSLAFSRRRQFNYHQARERIGTRRASRDKRNEKSNLYVFARSFTGGFARFVLYLIIGTGQCIDASGRLLDCLASNSIDFREPFERLNEKQRQRKQHDDRSATPQKWTGGKWFPSTPTTVTIH